MLPTDEQYASRCQMISLLTNLEVQVFDVERALRLHYARYDLPAVLERLKQEALIRVLQQPLLKEHVYRFRDPFQLELVAVGIWNDEEYEGTIVVGPFISKAYHPQLLKETGQKEHLPLMMQRQLQQYYNTLTMVNEAKLSAIGFFLINLFLPGLRQPQLVESVVPLAEGASVKFKYEMEQNRELVERRYDVENKILYAITQGDAHLLKQAAQEFKRLPWPYRLPQAPVRSVKNLSLSINTLFRKAAEGGGVHPLYLDSISGKFAIQIEQAQSIGELEALFTEMPQVYCNTVRELALIGLSPLVKEAVTSIRFTLDEPISLNSLADTLGVHPSYLSRAFKKEMGITLTDYINKLRIEEAKYMLDQGNVSVSETALSVGYNDPNYFSKVFTKLEHMTPHDYRKRKK
jgi:AraC-like DNA-binding protein